VWTSALGLAGLAVLGTAVASCASADASPQPCYDPVTRRLLRLDADFNGDGVIDQRTYII